MITLDLLAKQLLDNLKSQIWCQLILKNFFWDFLTNWFVKINTHLQTCGQPELRNFIGLNLAVIYIRSGMGGSRGIEVCNTIK